MINSAAFAGEFVVLTSGARLYVDRHEADASTIRLYHGTGVVELASTAVRGYEAEEYAAPMPATPAVGAAVEAATAPAILPSPVSPREMADAAADKYGLPRQLVRSVMAAESGFQPHAVSPKGAIGLMQLMPATALALGADPHDPAQNVDAGTRYLRGLLEKYHGGLRHALAAYNAGPAAVEKYEGHKYGGVPPYAETINYIGRIEKKLRQAGALPTP